ncbi:hypothetical protein Q762_09120 [Flavobacterium cauense R2A-7]|nr:hypothetical protein Q762_09120 [Flavobacterium cauense R2A-7]
MCVLSSCEKDLYEDAFQNDNAKMIVKRMNKKDLEKFPLLQQKLNHIELFKNSVHNKIITDTVYNFAISTDEAVYIEEGDYHSFTFPINRKDSYGKLENLLVSKNKEGGYNTFLVQYDFSALKLKTITKEELKTHSTKFTYIDFDSNNLLNSKIGAFSVYMCSETWTGVEHEIYEGNYDGDAVDVEIIWTNTASTCSWVATTDGFFGSGGTTSSTSSGNGTGNTGGSTPNTGSSNIDIVGTLYTAPTPCTNCPDLNLMYADFLSELNNTQLSYLNANLDIKEQIKNYFNQPGASSAFALEALNNIINGGDSDFRNEVILHQSVKNNQKLKCVFDKLKGLSSTIFNDIINDNFASSKKAHIRFEIGNTPNGEDAVTLPFIGNPNDPTSAVYKVIINSNSINNLSNIEIALIYIHESIHAELLDRCFRLGLIRSISYQNGTPNIIFNDNPDISYNTSDTLFSALAIHYFHYDGGSEWNHNLFTILNYRTKMVQNLINIHPWLNSSNSDFVNNVNNDPYIVGGPYSLQQLMEYISWIGLEGTQEYNNTIFNNQNELSKKVYIQIAAKTKYTNNCN